MINYTNSNHWGAEIEWYICDKNNSIAVFASAGGYIPENLLGAIDFFLSFSENIRESRIISKDIFINKNISSILGIDDKKSLKRYLEDFIYLAERGLYVYDKTNIEEQFDDKYHLVASPLVPLKLRDLSTTIQANFVIYSNIDFDSLSDIASRELSN